MAIIERTYGKESNVVIDEVLISSDSHVIEPEGLWKKQLPKVFQDRAPDFGGQRPNDTPGGAMDKNKRVSEMAADGVSAEVLYPTHGLKCLPAQDVQVDRYVEMINSLYELIYSGVLERFPKLKVVLVENELGWIPFVLEQWDYYFKRHGPKREGLAIKKLPSEYFHNQIYTTFFNDAVGGHILSWWGTDNCMWSNDFPHGNSTWPNSRQVVARDLGDLPAPLRAKLVRENVARLYDIPVPSPV